MTLHRAYISEKLLSGAAPNSTIELPKEVVHRLTKVLRLPPKAEVELFDGSGKTVRGVLVSPTLSDFLVMTVQHQNSDATRLTLVQALVKQDKLEEIVQHATELGTHQILLFSAARSLVKVTERTPLQIERLSRIAIDAARQCERSDVPDLIGPLSFQDLVLDLKERRALIMIGDPRQKTRLNDVLSATDLTKTREIVLVIGPEGGLEPSESQMLLHIGAKSVTYARFVLRTQTAGLAGMSIIQSFIP